MASTMSPLARAERMLAARLIELERALDKDPSRWPDYLDTVRTLLWTREVLRGQAGPPVTRGDVRRAFMTVPSERRRGD
jgi:hypothetical protein